MLANPGIVICERLRGLKISKVLFCQGFIAQTMIYEDDIGRHRLSNGAGTQFET